MDVREARRRSGVVCMWGLVCTVAAAFSLFGCSGMDSQTEDASEVVNKQPAEQSSQVQPEQTPEVNLISSYTVTEANAYSDELSVVVTEELGPCLVNTDGEVVAELPTDRVSNFYDGFAVAALESESCDSIINAKGQVVWSLDEDADSFIEQYLGDYTVESTVIALSYKNAFYGCVPVGFEVDSFAFSGFAYCIIDGNGSLLMEPRFQESSAPSTNGPHFIGDDYVYDILDREINELDDDKLSDLIGEVENQNYFDLHDGLKYEETIGGDKEKLVNASGETVIDLSEYDVYNAPEFEDGYALLGIYNEEHSPYITMIDTSGAFLFEPIRNPYYTGNNIPWSAFGEGKFFFKTDEETNRRVDNGMFIGPDGETVGDVRGDNATRFSGGLAWIDAGENGSYICIDDSGNPVFGFEPEPIEG